MELTKYGSGVRILRRIHAKIYEKKALRACRDVNAARGPPMNRRHVYPTADFRKQLFTRKHTTKPHTLATQSDSSQYSSSSALTFAYVGSSTSTFAWGVVFLSRAAWTTKPIDATTMSAPATVRPRTGSEVNAAWNRNDHGRPDRRMIDADADFSDEMESDEAFAERLKRAAEAGQDTTKVKRCTKHKVVSGRVYVARARFCLLTQT
mgnify:CR=1 FL=1